MPLIEVVVPEDVEIVRELFKEYQKWLGFDLCFQNFDQELATLPGAYARPAGTLLLWKEENEPAGCVALRPIEPPDIAELKRLYVRDKFRGKGLGRVLTVEAIERARKAGYKKIRLDTLSHMKDARRLYEKLGFYDIGAYRYNPFPDAVYMEKVIGPEG